MTHFPPPQQKTPPAGWYPNQWGQQQWWDGQQWGPVAPHQQHQAQQVRINHPRYANNMPVSYVRAQQGHSLSKHLVWGIFCAWINVIYISISPNHYWHT